MTTDRNYQNTCRKRGLHGCTARLLLMVLQLFVLAPAFSSDENVIRMGIDASALGTGDPHRAASRNDRAVVDMIFNGLLRYVPGNAPSIEPDLAISFPEPVFIEGRQTWTFELRRDAFCHPGPQTEGYWLTADDVVYSLRRAANPEHSAYAGDYDGVSVTKVDEFKIQVSFETPLSSILFLPKVSNYAGGLIICSKAEMAMGSEAFAAHPVGTGPFMFEGQDADNTVRLAANKRYFRGIPRLAGVEVHYVPSFPIRAQALKDGKLDVIFGSEQPAWFNSAISDPDLEVDVFGVGQVVTIHLNTSVKPLDDSRVRKAILHGIDRDTFKSLFANGVVKNTYSPVPVDFLPGGLTREEIQALGLDYKFDPAIAKEHLAAAGYKDGFRLKVVSSVRDHYLLNYESLRDQLASLGIEVEIETVEHREMHKRIRADENPIVIYVAWRPNADNFLTRFFHSDSVVVSGASPDTNFSHYTKIDDLIEAARTIREPEQQVRIWKQAQVRLLDDAVAYPLHYISLVYARAANVKYGHDLRATMALYPQFTEATYLE